jgi:hypothetical protein
MNKIHQIDRKIVAWIETWPLKTIFRIYSLIFVLYVAISLLYGVAEVFGWVKVPLG